MVNELDSVVIVSNIFTFTSMLTINYKKKKMKVLKQIFMRIYDLLYIPHNLF